jgi:hypothetical protein
MTKSNPLPILARRVLGVALLTLALAGAPVAAGPAAAATFRLVYQGSVGDAPVLSAVIESTTAGGTAALGRYAMSAEIGLLGSLAQMFPFRLQAQASGTAGPAVMPERYRSQTWIFDQLAEVTLDYGADGSVALQAVPPTVEGREAVARGLADDTLDPLSAVAAAVDHVARTNGCDGTFAVFDGTRRYELAFSHVGRAEVAPLRGSLYAGPAIECRVVPVLQSGFAEREARGGVYPREVSLWLAPVLEDAPPLPVRLLARSSLGTLLVDLIEARTIN